MPDGFRLFKRQRNRGLGWSGRRVRIWDAALSVGEVAGLDQFPPPDSDADGLDNDLDNCPGVRNADQADVDHDGLGGSDAINGLGGNDTLFGDDCNAVARAHVAQREARATTPSTPGTPSGRP
jgi:hypothetical protein